LAGYLSTFPEKNLAMVGGLTLLTLVMVISVIAYLPKMISNRFYPSFSAFTFPFVITAIGLKLAANFLAASLGSNLLYYPAWIVELLAVGLVVFVTVKYTTYLVPEKKKGISPTESSV
jgi:exfoliative toxin A/B